MGIDTPKSSMPCGKEAKEELVKLVQGKCVRVLVYGEDRLGRCVGDIIQQWQICSGSNAEKGACMALLGLRPTRRTHNCE
ncbi:hypothetical protein V6N13_033217 [Hibiscus sabdariffa]|uniref:TNase-like domain-containing protein n=1 Tax=Hibiscus sabdariffa TaxID=183260 RepID=A0ABR2FB62_9ROSI